MSRPHIDQVRRSLMRTLDELCNPAVTPDLERAKAVAQVAAVLVESAKVEVEYLKVTSQQGCAFLGEPDDIEEVPLPAPALPRGARVERTKHGNKIAVNGVTQHRMAG